MNIVLQLGDIASVVMGQASPGKDCNKEGNGYPFVKAGEFSGDRPVVREWTTNPLKKAKDGDVLVCVVGATAGKVNLGIDCAIGRSVAAVRPLPQRLNTSYLHHFLKTKTLVLRHGSQGLAQGVITREMLLGLEIPLPSLEEQRRIAAILDKAGQILSSSRQTDFLRQHLQERLFISMFGDPRSNSLGWARMSIEALTSDYVGGAALVPEDFVAQGVPVLHKGAIKPGGRIEVDSKKKGFVTPQTALHHTRNLAGPDRIAVTLRDLVPSGPFIGLMADLSTTAIPEYILAQGAYAFRVDESKVLPDYLIALVNMPAFRLVLRQNAVGSTQIHIRLPVFKSIEIPVPPIEIQHKFARIISHISSIDALGRDRIQRINELTRALQSSSFSGQPI
jgi:type I restriction enzyme S subunit